jgi:hypothetical protein
VLRHLVDHDVVGGQVTLLGEVLGAEMDALVAGADRPIGRPVRSATFVPSYQTCTVPVDATACTRNSCQVFNATVRPRLV